MSLWQSSKHVSFPAVAIAISGAVSKPLRSFIHHCKVLRFPVFQPRLFEVAIIIGFKPTPFILNHAPYPLKCVNF